MKLFKITLSIFTLSLSCNSLLFSQECPVVKICNEPSEGCASKELLTDFDCNEDYETFVIKGVGYAPTPIGKFIGGEFDAKGNPIWSALCSYVGSDELSHGEKRFIIPGTTACNGGNCFQCAPNGSHYYNDLAILNRDFRLIQQMNANTIRTWGKVTPRLLEKANEYGLKVIAGFWISHETDFVRGDLNWIRNEFIDYVRQYKDNPAILMWGLSNENNTAFCSWAPNDQACVNQQATAFYNFVNGLAATTKQMFPNVQPIMIVTAEMNNLKEHASLLSNIDILGINSYRGKTFGNLFQQFQQTFPNKPMLLTEFGTDAFITDPNQPNETGNYRFTPLFNT